MQPLEDIRATRPTPEEIAAHEKRLAKIGRRAARRSFVGRWFERLTFLPYPQRRGPDPFPGSEAEIQRGHRAELARLRGLRRSLPPAEIEEASRIADRMAAIKRLMRAGGGVIVLHGPPKGRPIW